MPDRGRVTGSRHRSRCGRSMSDEERDRAQDARVRQRRPRQAGIPATGHGAEGRRPGRGHRRLATRRPSACATPRPAMLATTVPIECRGPPGRRHRGPVVGAGRLHAQRHGGVVCGLGLLRGHLPRPRVSLTSSSSCAIAPSKCHERGRRAAGAVARASGCVRTPCAGSAERHAAGRHAVGVRAARMLRMLRLRERPWPGGIAWPDTEF
jgi:hypothetical protein